MSGKFFCECGFSGSDVTGNGNVLGLLRHGEKEKPKDRSNQACLPMKS